MASDPPLDHSIIQQLDEGEQIELRFSGDCETSNNDEPSGETKVAEPAAPDTTKNSPPLLPSTAISALTTALLTSKQQMTPSSDAVLPLPSLQRSIIVVDRRSVMDFVQWMPLELCRDIFATMRPRELSLSGTVSRSWRVFARDQQIWKLVCEREWSTKLYLPLQLHPLVEWSSLLHHLDTADLLSILARRGVIIHTSRPFTASWQSPTFPGFSVWTTQDATVNPPPSAAPHNTNNTSSSTTHQQRIRRQRNRRSRRHRHNHPRPPSLHSVFSAPTVPDQDHLFTRHEEDERHELSESFSFHFRMDTISPDVRSGNQQNGRPGTSGQHNSDHHDISTSSEDDDDSGSEADVDFLDHDAVAFRAQTLQRTVRAGSLSGAIDLSPLSPDTFNTQREANRRSLHLAQKSSSSSSSSSSSKLPLDSSNSLQDPWDPVLWAAQALDGHQTRKWLRSLVASTTPLHSPFTPPTTADSATTSNLGRSLSPPPDQFRFLMTLRQPATGLDSKLQQPLQVCEGWGIWMASYVASYLDSLRREITRKELSSLDWDAWVAEDGRESQGRATFHDDGMFTCDVWGRREWWRLRPDGSPQVNFYVPLTVTRTPHWGFRLTNPLFRLESRPGPPVVGLGTHYVVNL